MSVEGSGRLCNNFSWEGNLVGGEWEEAWEVRGGGGGGGGGGGSGMRKGDKEGDLDKIQAKGGVQ